MTFIADLHIHSSYSFDNHGGPSPIQIIQHASYSGLDAIAITDHNLLTFSHKLRQLAYSLEVLLIPGMEVTTREGHLIAIGVTEEIPSELSTQHSIQLLRVQKAVIIAAHPFDPVYGFGDLIFDFDIDAVEFNGSKRRPNQWNRDAIQASEIMKLSVVGGSDAHELKDIGRAITYFKDIPKDLSDLLQLIRQGRCYGSKQKMS